jgi:ribose transport system permease protein
MTSTGNRRLAGGDIDADAGVGEEPGRRRTWRQRALGSSVVYLGGALLVAIAFFAAKDASAFLSAFNIRQLFTQASLLLIEAVGATYVIATAGIDLSVGGVLVISGVIAVKLMTYLGGQGWGVALAGLACTLAVGLAFGLANGLLVAKARIPALIATLGTFGVSMGIAQVITGGSDFTGVPGVIVNGIGQGRLLGQVPWIVVAAVLITVGAGVVLHHARFGQYTLAIGSNSEAARRAGVKVSRQLIKIYVLASVLAGLDGYLNLAFFATTSIAGHNTDNLAAISSVVLGGTSLFGGVATIIGTVIGVFIPSILQNGFVIIGIPPFWQEVAVGVVLVIAVYVDQLRRSARERT